MMNSRPAADTIVSVGESGVKAVVYSRGSRILRYTESFPQLSAWNQQRISAPHFTLINGTNGS